MIANVLIERKEERVTRFGSSQITSASLEHSFERILGVGDVPDSTMMPFKATYDGHSNVVNLVTGGLFLDLAKLKGQRIGTYLMCSVVRWARQWPSAQVATIELVEGQASSDNKDRRNWLYEQFGIQFDYVTDDKLAGRSRPMRVADLLEVTAWEKNIAVQPLDTFLAQLVHAHSQVTMDLKFRDEAVRDLWDEEKRRERRPIRWAVWVTLRNVFYGRWSAQAVVATGLVVAAVAWGFA